MTKDDKASSESLRLILVVFLGGCTFSEISALRFLGREVRTGLHGIWGAKGKDLRKASLQASGYHLLPSCWGPNSRDPGSTQHGKLLGPRAWCWCTCDYRLVL